jgi:flagellar basal body L-ring protein FlgH
MQTRFIMTLAIVAALLAGCEKKPAPSPSASSKTGSTPAGPESTTLPAGFMLASRPESAKTVEEHKAAAKVGDTVAITGRVGGSEEPFLDDRAMLVLMGPGLNACSDNKGDECKTPWDYCCEKKSDVAKHAATIRVVGADGKPIKTGLKGQGGMKELSTLVVVGKVSQLDENGTMVVDATGIYVEKP